MRTLIIIISGFFLASSLQSCETDINRDDMLHMLQGAIRYQNDLLYRLDMTEDSFIYEEGKLAGYHDLYNLLLSFDVY